MKQLINEFKKVRQEFIILIDQIPKRERDTLYIGEWTLKDLLSHFIGWANFQTKLVNDLIRGNEPANISNVQKYNESSVQVGKNWHWDKTYREFLKAGERLISSYLFIPKELWQKPIWKNKKTTPAKLIKIETGHYQGEHLTQIKSLLHTT